jgi:hypothetical protein
MLDAFEARLADLLADALADEAGIATPRRSLPGEAVAPGLVLPVVRVTAVAADPLLGDDAPLVRRLPGGGLGLRTVFALRGDVALDLIPGADVTRPALLRALDAALVALGEEAVRRGAAFADGTDQGFALRGFRFREAAPPSEPGATGLRAVFAFEGEFWPVRPEAEGPAIATIPTRMATLPVAAPEGLSAQAGGPDLTIPLRLDLRRLGAAPGNVLARLSGADPPGALLGATPPPGAPAGAVAVPVAADGTADLGFRPAAALGAPAVARITLSLARAGGTGPALGEIAVQVRP